MLPCASGSCSAEQSGAHLLGSSGLGCRFQERKPQMVLNLSWPGFLEICPLSPRFRALSHILAEGAPCPGGVVGGGVGSVGGATAGTD